MGDNKEMKVTSLSQLKKYMNGNIVRLPDFAEGQEFYARLKRPSLLGMVKSGKIPNELLTKTNELFVGGSEEAATDVDNQKLMSDMFDIFETLAKETFVEPSYDDLINNGIELTDQQLMFVYNYSQDGVSAYSNFRTDEKDRNDNNNVAGLQVLAE